MYQVHRHVLKSEMQSIDGIVNSQFKYFNGHFNDTLE
jgi:hypothetical protein